MQVTLASALVPELPEVEAYRQLAERVVGRVIVSAEVRDPRFARGVVASVLEDALAGRRIESARRIGKLLVLDTDGPALGIRFGMTGRLVVDGVVGVDRLVYSSERGDPAWDRFRITFEPTGTLVVSDPRLLGGVTLDPDETKIGPDALTLTAQQLRLALVDSTAPLKARLMDQARIAGAGNLIADEVLWRASLDPARPAGSLSTADQRRLLRHLRSALSDMAARGGSHTGDLMPERHRGGHCPRDGVELERRTIGGRTTFSCPRHQR